jgi:hypothetical protein
MSRGHQPILNTPGKDGQYINHQMKMKEASFFELLVNSITIK